MRYFALATDYDGTIAHDGHVDDATVEALRRVSASGRKLLLVTGRELPDLQTAFPHLDIFDWVVAENGALLYSPSTHEEVLVAESITDEFVKELERREVAPLSTGRVIVATWEPHETAVLETIRDLGLELQVIFNKGAVMVLPSGVNKATGLARALSQLELSTHNVVGIGDAENDHAFLSVCELSAAVANALPLVKERADLVTKADHGAGVIELIDQLLEDELQSVSEKIARHTFPIGTGARGREVLIPAYGPNLLLTGPSGSGKSTLAKAFLEKLTDLGYQYCVIDPEGDYEDFEEAVVLGNRSRVPAFGEVLQLLKDPTRNAVVNLLGVELQERPSYFSGLLAALLEMRARTGRPHWLMLDEAHHILPKQRQPGALTLPQHLNDVASITLEPQEMMPEVLATIDTIFVVGESPNQRLSAFAEAIGAKPPRYRGKALAVGEALAWQPGKPVVRFAIAPTRFEHRRHRRKYAEGDVGPDLSFYFTGADKKLNLRAQNLILFAQLAQGVDDETWQYHLKRGHYVHWFRNVIKDDELAAEAQRVAKVSRLAADESRRRIVEAIRGRYTLPGSGGETSVV